MKNVVRDSLTNLQKGKKKLHRNEKSMEIKCVREQVLRCGRNIFQKKTRSSSTIKFTERNNLRQPASPSKKNIKKSPDLVTNQAIVHGEPAHHIFFKYQVRIVWNMIISLNTIE